MSRGAAFGAPAPADSSLWVTTYLDRKRRSYVVVLAPAQRLEGLPREQIRELTPAGALQWAQACLAAAAAAEHDAAVLTQVRGIGLRDEDAAGLIGTLRADRAAAHQLPATNGYTLTPSVSATARPFLILSVDDEPVGEWSPAAARRHALHVLEATAVADLDGAYFRALVDRFDTSEGRASNVVADLEKRRTAARS